MIKNIKNLLDYYGHKNQRIECLTDDRAMKYIFKDALGTNLIGLDFLQSNIDFIKVCWLPYHNLIVEREGFLDIYSSSLIREKGCYVSSDVIFDILKSNFSDSNFMRCINFLTNEQIVAILLSYDLKEGTYDKLLDKYGDVGEILNAILYSKKINHLEVKLHGIRN